MPLLCYNQAMSEVQAYLAIDISAYHNRWIAVVYGQVAGVGLTAEQAYRAAKRIRPKRKPHLMFINNQGKRVLGKEWLTQQPLLKQVVDILQDRQIESYLVGGAVRDMLLGRTVVPDLDFVVPKNGLKTARFVADTLGGAFYALDESRDTGRVICNDAHKSHLDFSSYRGPDLLTDLAVRDFTINAIALKLDHTFELIDPFQGQVDIELKRIQLVSDEALQNDPIRVLRAVRQSIQLNFTIEPKARRQIKVVSPLIMETVSPERQRDELVKLFNTPTPGQALKRLHELAVLSHIMPEVSDMVGVAQSAPHYLDVFDHTVATLDVWEANLLPSIDFDAHPLSELAPWRAELETYLNQQLAGNISYKALVPFAILLHDTGKPMTQSHDDGKIRFLGHEQESVKIARQIMTNLRFSGEAIAFVTMIVKNHMRPLTLSQQDKVSRRAIYRLFRANRYKSVQSGIALALHALADHYGTYPAGKGQGNEKKLLAIVLDLFKAYFEQNDKLVNPSPILTGRDIIDRFNIEQGRLIGRLIRELREAQAIGTVTDETSAIEFITSALEHIRSGDGN
ncbi:HDIG domain-containing protein [Anaerolineales bacterium HSG24]|nr:HDIG domain-containing protein [Anaerolineales bacterium HSG24]